jgi:hypothetical protein
MIRTAKHFLQLAAVACVILAGSIPPTGQSSPTVEVDEAICQQLQFRRLHLVRPDLIRYPLVFEVYC